MKQTLRMVSWAVLVLAVFGPSLTRLAACLIPVVLVVGLVAAGLRVLWFYTGRW